MNSDPTWWSPKLLYCSYQKKKGGGKKGKAGYVQHDSMMPSSGLRQAAASDKRAPLQTADMSIYILVFLLSFESSSRFSCTVVKIHYHHLPRLFLCLCQMEDGEWGMTCIAVADKINLYIFLCWCTFFLVVEQLELTTIIWAEGMYKSKRYVLKCPLTCYSVTLMLK